MTIQDPFIENAKQIGILSERNRIAEGLLALTGDTVDRLEVLQFVVYPFLHPTIEGEQDFNPNDLTVCDKCPTLISKGVYAEELGMCLDCSNDYYDHKEEGF